MRFGPYAAPYLRPDPEAEKEALKTEAEDLQSELDSVKKRLEELEAKTAAQQAP
jgi:predicted nuclease with TOPRIM domain